MAQYLSRTSGGTGGLVAAGAGGAALGYGASSAQMWAKRVQTRANVGLGLSLGIATADLIGGNDANNQAVQAANTANTVNGITVAADVPTIVALRAQLAQTNITLSKLASDVDPLSNLGLRNPPTLPAVNTATAGVAAISTSPTSGLGSIGILLVAGLLIWVVTKD